MNTSAPSEPYGAARDRANRTEETRAAAHEQDQHREVDIGFVFLPRMPRRCLQGHSPTHSLLNAVARLRRGGRADAG
jgi:hypothetical protein